MSSSVDRWIHGEGRLGEPALREPAGGDSPIPPGAPVEQVIRNRVCWRCGATLHTSSPCTEKRGDGPPWRHEFLDRDDPNTHPWVDWPLDDLFDLCLYLGGKSRSSLATAESFQALVESGKALGYSRTQRYSFRFAFELYREKAQKRIRLFDWALAEYERRLGEEVRDAAPGDPDPR